MQKTIWVLLTVGAMFCLATQGANVDAARKEYTGLRKEIVEARVKAIKADPKLQKLHEKITDLQKELTEKIDDSDRSLRKKTARLAELEKTISDASVNSTPSKQEK